MASTDTRSGFRLPWSSDRSHEDPAPDGQGDTTTEAAGQAEPAPDAVADPTWPTSDARETPDGATPDEQAQEATASPTVDTEEPSPMVEIAPPPVVVARKPSKLMADLSAAIRATAEAAQVATQEQVATESREVVEAIRASSTEGSVTLKHRSDEDIAAIREWSKAEIARIREETDARITARKANLEDELAGYAAAVERRVEEVESEVARFEEALAAYRARLEEEHDPARLATMAEEVPETPSFDAWMDTSTLAATQVDADALADDGSSDMPDGDASGDEDARAIADRVAALAGNGEIGGATDGASDGASPGTDWYAAAEVAAAEATPDGPWSDSTSAWNETTAVDGHGSADDDVPRWDAGETPDGFPPADGDEGGDPVDRGAIMAALEAAAEAVVAAESAAESADQAEAAADVAETAAELLVGRNGADEETDPEAAAAMSARVDAGGFETESFQDRLASLMPGADDAAVGDEERTTQVVVSGLVSVASIASFKRHLGRLAGVRTVAVASGPEGEFVFNVTHRADVSFRDALPTMPGFAARVTGTSEGVIAVSARDPESEG